MPSIQLHILDGPAANRRQVFEQDTITYGRDADCDIALTLATASRRHGELQFKDGKWLVNNLSANGSEVNGKAVKKPRALGDGDTVSIGKQPIFRVHSIAATAADASALEAQVVEDDDASSDAMTSSGKTTGMDRSTKMLPRILIASAVLSIVMIVLGQVITDDTPTDAGQPIVLTSSVIADDVRRPIIVQFPEPREAPRYLEQAQQYFNQLDVRPENVYYAWEAYQLALAHSGKTRFENGLDQRQFLHVQERLARDVERQYVSATDKIRAGDYAQAARELGALLTRVYPRRDGPLVQNISDQRTYASAKVTR
jgi:pSer/pThr/pTyr-binding forkhead associated (FHA) protein